MFLKQWIFHISSNNVTTYYTQEELQFPHIYSYMSQNGWNEMHGIVNVLDEVSEILTAVDMKTFIFWGITACGRFTLNGVHDVIPQKIEPHVLGELPEICMYVYVRQDTPNRFSR
jgi:hypothetical protein